MNSHVGRHFALLLTRTISLITLLSLGAVVGCTSFSKDPKTPEGAVNQYIAALKKQDHEAIYAMLAPSIRADITAIYQNTTKMVDLVVKSYPSDLQASTLKDINAASLAGVTDPKSFFLKLMKKQPLPSISKWAFYGSMIKKSTIKGANATVSTLKGDEFHLVKGDDGVWTILLKEKAFRSARRKTEKNLKKIQQNIAKLKMLRTQSF
ncbi:MAG: hypothetical protein KC609_00015 [Myxococcales bacterium]|nr:hypothetical protein [Myxococcales bacterium]